MIWYKCIYIKKQYSCCTSKYLYIAHSAERLRLILVKDTITVPRPCSSLTSAWHCLSASPSSVPPLRQAGRDTGHSWNTALRQRPTKTSQPLVAISVREGRCWHSTTRPQHEDPRALLLYYGRKTTPSPSRQGTEHHVGSAVERLRACLGCGGGGDGERQPCVWAEIMWVYKRTILFLCIHDI